MICILTYRDSPAIKVYAWSDPKRGIIALEMFSKGRIEELRGTIRDWGAKGGEKYEYETYLNDAIVERYLITILLRRKLRTISTDKLAGHLSAKDLGIASPSTTSTMVVSFRFVDLCYCCMIEF